MVVVEAVVGVEVVDWSVVVEELDVVRVDVETDVAPPNDTKSEAEVAVSPALSNTFTQ